MFAQRPTTGHLVQNQTHQKNGSVQVRNPLIQDLLNDTLDQLWFVKGFFDLVPIFIKLQLDQLQ